VVARCFDTLPLWAELASDVSGKAVACGHYIPEEAPEALLEEMFGFFR
jgi:haloacetate dehalogenase